MIKVRGVDMAGAEAINDIEFDNSHAAYTYEVATLLAAHRQQAEEAMQERCAKVAERQYAEPRGWAGHYINASLGIATAIRSIDAGGEGGVMRVGAFERAQARAMTPTDQEVEAVARAIAKATNVEVTWPHFVDKARAAIAALDQVRATPPSASSPQP